jgi:hypothetical protein
MLCIANNISLHLAGCKKVQQVLAKPGQLELFVHSESELAQLRDVFAGLYTLDKNELRDNANTDSDAERVFTQIKQKAMDNPNMFVMKPQREGGGNNIYKEHITSALQSMNEEELAAYILMERIFPPAQQAVLVRDGQLLEVSFCTEVWHVLHLLI